MKRDDYVIEILTDLVEESLDIEGALFEAVEAPLDAHSSPETAKVIQAGALAAGRTAGIEAKAAGLDRNGVRFAVAQAVRTHTENWRQFREAHPIPEPKEPTEQDLEHAKAMDGLKKEIGKLKDSHAMGAIKAKVELAKLKADSKIEIIRMRSAQKAKALTGKKKAGR